MHLFSVRLGRALALVVGLTLLTANMVVADDLVADGDDLTPVANNALAFGTVCVGQTYVDQALLAINRNQANDGNDHLRVFNDSATVTLSFRTTPPSASTDVSETYLDSQIILPADWESTALGTKSTDTGRLEVTLVPSTVGANQSTDINLRSSGRNNLDDRTINRDTILKATWSAVSCNTAPSAPGKPAPTPASPNQGGFTLNWTASTDDGNPNPPGAITYALEGKRTGESFTSVESGITTNWKSFTTGNPAQGTWIYRVQASDSALTSPWSLESDPVVVDRTAPTLETCPAAGPFLLNSGGGSESVGPISASDPALPDTSAGSGVNSGGSTLSGSVNTTSVGNKSVTFTAVDNAGNSASKSCSYSVIYNFTGFFSPVDNGGTLNKAKAGQAIPLKWRLTDANGDPVLTLSGVTVTAANLTCSLGTSLDLVEEYATGSSGLQNMGDGYYQFNWATPKSYANSCKTAKLNLGEGTGFEHTALFQFTK